MAENCIAFASMQPVRVLMALDKAYACVNGVKLQCFDIDTCCGLYL